MTFTKLPYGYQRIGDDDFEDEDLEELMIYKEINAKRDKRSILFAKIGVVFLICFVIFMYALNRSGNNSNDSTHNSHEHMSNFPNYNLTNSSLNTTSVFTNSTADLTPSVVSMTSSYNLVATTGSVYNNKYGYYYSQEMHFLHFSDDVSNSHRTQS